jgi:hypothetical protein
VEAAPPARQPTPSDAATIGSADLETGWGPDEKRRYFRSVCPGLESIDGVPMDGTDFDNFFQ